jgi:5-hydroxyisourate hydrolase
VITTHVLDTARGRPAAGVPVVLERRDGDGWTCVGEAVTDADGRAGALLPAGSALEATAYRLRFDTAAHLGAGAFFPEVVLTFAVTRPREHHHVPLLLSRYGYTTYRGS